ncbi:hypothetical protein FTO68_06265 [Methanocalculus taiwanensis]|uniref:Uncharacterized protein n=1 Tax=Methanocalculus taiwanensis TaxID=106207 RepID=A0ABD4TLG0_9EURY|nr:hypothetical protein [Methanocalculus taiwanensis]MCQ1538589.1 hypothetical protein [Methanocalculus taiwanensis]
MSLYPLIRPLKAGGASALSISRAAFGKAAAGLKSLPEGAKVTMSKLGRYAAYPAGIGAGVGLGSLAAGEGIRAGFGFDLSDPAGVKKASGTITGVAIFAAVVLLLVFVYFKVIKG